MASNNNIKNIRPDVLNKLQITSGLLSKYADRVFNSEISISQSQFAVLLIISSIESPVKQGEIAVKLQRESNSTSMMIERLVKIGLIKRTRSDIDHRDNHLALTQAGMDKLARGKRVNEMLARQIMGIFTDHEIGGIMDILVRLEEQVTKRIDHNPHRTNGVSPKINTGIS